MTFFLLKFYKKNIKIKSHMTNAEYLAKFQDFTANWAIENVQIGNVWNLSCQMMEKGSLIFKLVMNFFSQICLQISINSLNMDIVKKNNTTVFQDTQRPYMRQTVIPYYLIYFRCTMFQIWHIITKDQMLCFKVHIFGQP